MRTRIEIATLVAATIGVIAAAGNAGAQSYVATPLGTLSGCSYTYDAATAINSSGQIVGQAVNANCTVTAFLYDPATHTMQDLGYGPGTEFSVASGINDAGIVVGNGGGHAFVWDAANGIRNLQAPPGTTYVQTFAFGINNSGVIVGTTTTPSSFRPVPCVWDLATGPNPLPDVITAMPPSPDLWADARAINDSGVIAGSVMSETYGDPYYIGHAALWQKSGGVWTFTDLGQLDGQFTEATAINNLGQVAGRAGTATGEAAWLYAGGTLSSLPALGPGNANAFGINDQTIVVGSHIPPRGGTGPGAAFVWTAAGGVVALPNLGGGGNWDVAYAVNSAGTIVGKSTDADGNALAVRWDSVSNTPTGTDVSVTPPDTTTGDSNVTITFATVTQAGSTSVTSAPNGNQPPFGYQLGEPAVFYELSTSAIYSAPITVCIGYAGITFPGTPALLHYEGTAWVDRTTSVDAGNMIVCGSVSSLSPFALMVAPKPFTTLSASVDLQQHKGRISVHASFTLGPGSNGVAPASEGLLVQAAAWSVFIPAGSFAQSGKSGPYRFSGTIAGAQVDATLNGHNKGRWDFDLSADNAPETLPDPTPLTITLGDDRGGISVHPVIHH